MAKHPSYLRPIRGKLLDTGAPAWTPSGRPRSPASARNATWTRELAQRLGLTVTQLAAYETGAARLPASVLHALARSPRRPGGGGVFGRQARFPTP